MNSYNQFHYNTERRQKHSLCQAFLKKIIIFLALIPKASIRTTEKYRSNTSKKTFMPKA